MKMRYLLAIVAFVVFQGSAISATIYVPDNYPTIQGAINASSNGDTIIVRSGTYKENIDFNGKAIFLRSEKGADKTVIDGKQAGSVVTFTSKEDNDSVLMGFTITNGTGTFDGEDYIGGGIYCVDAGPVIMHNIIEKNKMPLYDSWGGGIVCEYSPGAVIMNNIISENESGNVPGISVYTSVVFIRNNILTANTGWSHAIYGDYSALIITNNLIVDNSCGGIATEDSDLKIFNCTVANNAAYEGGGFQCDDGSFTLIRDSIFWGNQAWGGNGQEIWIGNSDYTSTVTIHHSVVKGGMSGVYMEPGCVLNWGAGMITANPMFIQGPEGRYYLSQDPPQSGVNNPCVNTGSGSALSLDMETGFTRTDEVPDSGLVDMGFHYTGRSLKADRFELSTLAGGAVTFMLDAGAANANRQYLLLAGVTGTTPGTPLPGGNATLPMNWDPFTGLVLDLINTPIFMNFMGQLDANGSAEAVFNTLGPLPPEAGGLEFTFAYALSTPFDFASNPVSVKILAPETWVDDNYNASTPGWQITRFDRIQDGIDRVSNGGTVHVENGTYNERIHVHRTIALSGNDKNNTVIEGGGHSNTAFLAAEGIAMSEFSIMNSGGTGDDAAMLVITGNCTIQDNILSATIGMILEGAFNASVTDNILQGCGIIPISDKVSDLTSHTITNNTVNGLPIRYYKNGNGVTIPANTGQVILANCTNMTVQGLTNLTNVDVPILMGFSSYCLIKGNKIANSFLGMFLLFSKNNTIIENEFNNMVDGGIDLLAESDNNNIGQNKITISGEESIYIEESSNNLVHDNVIDGCAGNAIAIEEGASGNKVYKNSIKNSEHGAKLQDAADFNEIYDNVFESNDFGIGIESSENNKIYNNIIKFSGYGIMFMFDADFNEVYENDFDSNEIGIEVYNSNNNLIYHNNFYNSIFYHATANGGSNLWDIGYPYPPNGGNHWDDWTSPDVNADGVVDNPYNISTGNVDNYPLVNPYLW